MSLQYRCARAILKIIFPLFYRYTIFGKENLIEGPAIIAPNHTSFLDPIAAGIAFDEQLWFVARKSLFKKGLVNYLLKKFNTLPITGTKEDRNTIRLVGEKIHDNKKILIFPEGERSWDGQIKPVKQGLARIALRNKCPIIPVYIHGAYEVWKRGQKIPYPYGNITCVYGSPIYVDDYLNLDTKEAYEKLSEHLKNTLLNLQQWFIDGANGSPP